MSETETPRTDNQEKRYELGLKGTAYVLADFARTLEHELNHAKAQLAAAEVRARRYEYVRRMSPNQFSELWKACIVDELRFDDEVDRRIEEGGK